MTKTQIAAYAVFGMPIKDLNVDTLALCKALALEPDEAVELRSMISRERRTLTPATPRWYALKTAMEGADRYGRDPRYR